MFTLYLFIMTYGESDMNINQLFYTSRKIRQIPKLLHINLILLIWYELYSLFYTCRYYKLHLQLDIIGITLLGFTQVLLYVTAWRLCKCSGHPSFASELQESIFLENSKSCKRTPFYVVCFTYFENHSGHYSLQSHLT